MLLIRSISEEALHAGSDEDVYMYVNIYSCNCRQHDIVSSYDIDKSKRERNLHVRV